MKNKKRIKVLSIFLSITILICFMPLKASAESQVIKRIYGTSRYDTAAAISRETWNYTENVIIANGANFPDALAGVTLAYALHAPILLTDKYKLSTATAAEIKRLYAKNAYILGGTGAVSAQVEQSLKNMGCFTHRISGLNRTKTAIAIGDELKKHADSVDTIFLATGANYPDALSVGPVAADYAAPILFTEKDKLNTDTKNTISRWNIGYIIILGGTGVISDAVEKELRDMGKSVARLAGTNRFQTSLKIADTFKSIMNPEYISLATGSNFPDALAGGGLSSCIFSLLLLVNNNGDNTALKNFISSNKYGSMFVFGGTGVISDSVMKDISKYLNSSMYLKPAKPQNLQVQLVNPTEIKLTWDPENNVQYYNIYRNGYFTGSASPADNYYIDKNDLSLNTTYTYKVVGINSNGQGEFSDSVTITTPKAVPQAPTGISAKLYLDNTISFSWNPSTYATYYKIYRNGECLTTITNNNFFYDDKSALPNTVYTYKVLAGNSFGESGFSEGKTFSTYEYPALKPTNITATRITSTEVDLTWDAVPGATKYTVMYYGEGPTTITDTTTNLITLTGLTPNTGYQISIVSVTPAGQSNQSYYTIATTN